jgi:amino-acid N-acetyltransferase
VVVTIDRVRPDEIDEVQSLLASHRLPLDGLSDHVATLIVARQEGRVVGSAALEIYRDGALLRSVAVAPSAQGHGLGHDLTEAAVRMAQEKGLAAVYLLTTTAERFFPKLGFERIDRHDVPASVQASVEFASACPSSAVVMRKTL